MELKATTQKEIHKFSKDSIWDIAASRQMDCGKIERFLKEEAEDAIRGGVHVEEDSSMVQSEENDAIAKYKALSLKLEALYGDINSVRTDTMLMRDASTGVLEQRAPTGGAIFSWFLSLFLAGGIELLFFGYMVFFKGAGYALIGIAVILLVGGLFAGRGFSNIMSRSSKSEYETKASGIKFEIKDGVLISIGMLLIIGITAMRWIYGGYLAGIVALFLGLAVTTTESFLHSSKELRRYYLIKMFQAQHDYAAIQLAKDLGIRGNDKDDTWRTVYERYIRDAKKEYRDISMR